MARLVLNHSTNIEGLIKWLKRLAKEDLIKTITPASLSKAKNNSERLTLRISRKTSEGFKLIARKGSMTQDVYLITKVAEEQVIEMINKSNPILSHKKKHLNQ